MKKLTKLAIATLVAATAISAAPELKFNGDAQFRLREEWNMSKDAKDEVVDSLTNSAYYNKYGWNLKLAAVVNEQFSMKFRLSNPNGSGLEDVSSINSRKVGAKDGIVTKPEYIVTIPRAEMIWKPGKFALSAGILEVKSNTPLTLAAAADANGYQGRYALNSSSSWGVRYNNSQVGFKLGVDLGNVGFNIVNAIADKPNTIKNDKVDETNFRWIFDVPVKLADGKFTLIPTLVMRSGMSGHFQTRTTGMNAGLDVAGKINDMISFKAGAAYGLFEDINNDYGSFAKPAGFLAIVAPTVKFGMNKVTVGYSFGSTSDLDAADDAKLKKITNHIDVKWGVAVNKNFTIMPRFRTWFYNDDNDETAVGSTRIRPELIFSGKF